MSKLKAFVQRNLGLNGCIHMLKIYSTKVKVVLSLIHLTARARLPKEPCEATTVSPEKSTEPATDTCRCRLGCRC